MALTISPPCTRVAYKMDERLVLAAEYPLLLALLASLLTTYIYGFLCDEGYLYKREVEMVKLTCRTLNPKVDNAHTSGNRFAKEFDELFLYITDVLDFAACKYIDKATLPLLVQQEYNHALMHKVNKSSKYIGRFELIRIVMDFLLLRAGRTIGLGLGCAVEIGTSAFIHEVLNQNILQRPLSNAVLFHLMEEVEHSCLTSGHLRPQVAWYVRIALTPVVLFMLFIYAFGGVFTWLLTHPLDFLEWKMYCELIVYLLAFAPAFLAFCGETLLHYTPPSNFQGETRKIRDERIALMANAIKLAGVDFVEGASEAYPVVM